MPLRTLVLIRAKRFFHDRRPDCQTNWRTSLLWLVSVDSCLISFEYDTAWCASAMTGITWSNESVDSEFLFLLLGVNGRVSGFIYLSYLITQKYLVLKIINKFYKEYLRLQEGLKLRTDVTINLNWFLFDHWSTQVSL